jgi:hypothetical protein
MYVIYYAWLSKKEKRGTFFAFVCLRVNTVYNQRHLADRFWCHRLRFYVYARMSKRLKNINVERYIE